MEGLERIASFYEGLSKLKVTKANALQVAGLPSRSFLGAHRSSMLFDNEKAVLALPAPSDSHENDAFFKVVTGANHTMEVNKSDVKNNSLRIGDRLVETLPGPSFCEIRATIQR